MLRQLLLTKRWHGSVSFLLVSLALVFISGCKQEQLEQLAKQVQEQTIDKIAAPMKVLSTGSFKLQVTSPLETRSANARLIVIGDGRPNVLQLRSYQDMAVADYPMVLVQATTSATDVSQLSGQTMSATVYISMSKHEPIWSCMDQSVASLTISSIQDNLIKGDIRCEKLVSTQEISSPLSGSIEAVFPSAKVASAGMITPVVTASADRSVR